MGGRAYLIVCNAREARYHRPYPPRANLNPVRFGTYLHERADTVTTASKVPVTPKETLTKLGHERRSTRRGRLHRLARLGRTEKGRKDYCTHRKLNNRHEAGNNNYAVPTARGKLA